MLSADGVRELLAAFDLGTGQLSTAPVERGLLGEIWRLDTSRGRWAVKVATSEHADAENVDGAALQDAAVAAGVCSPAVRRTVDGAAVAVVEGHRLRVQSWVDGAAASTTALDPADIGRTVARLHRAATGLTVRAPVHSWYVDPVGAERWDDLLGRLGAAGAPFTPALSRLRDATVRLESSYLPASGWGPLVVGHRDLFADNVRAGTGGRVVVYDYDNAGPVAPAQELAFVLVEFAPGPDAAADQERAARLVASYLAAGGPGRVTQPGDFTMISATLHHIVQMWCERWLASADPGTRARAQEGVREYVDRPLTPAVVADFLRVVR